MSEKKTLSKEEVNNKLKALLNTSKAEKKTTRLSDEELCGVTGGVGAWAFELDGYVAMGVCSKSETTNALLEQCLYTGTACCYASPGATSCYNCTYLSVWGTSQKVV